MEDLLGRIMWRILKAASKQQVLQQRAVLRRRRGLVVLLDDLQHFIDERRAILTCHGQMILLRDLE
jgi:hypothetical protein